MRISVCSQRQLINESAGSLVGRKQSQLPIWYISTNYGQQRSAHTHIKLLTVFIGLHKQRALSGTESADTQLQSLFNLSIPESCVSVHGRFFGFATRVNTHTHTHTHTPQKYNTRIRSHHQTTWQLLENMQKRNHCERKLFFSFKNRSWETRDLEKANGRTKSDGENVRPDRRREEERANETKKSTISKENNTFVFGQTTANWAPHDFFLHFFLHIWM